jgi:hypothetical protein
VLDQFQVYGIVDVSSDHKVYSEKATKFCEIFTLLLSTVHTDKRNVKISQNYVAFSEYMNFTIDPAPFPKRRNWSITKRLYLAQLFKHFGEI